MGRSRGGFTTKFHLSCDGHGHPLLFHLTAGQAHDNTALVAVLNGADQAVVDGKGEPVAWPFVLAGDKGYRADRIDELLLEIGVTPVIPSKENEDRSARPVKFDRAAYRRRSIVENLMGWLTTLGRPAGWAAAVVPLGPALARRLARETSESAGQRQRI